MLKILRENKLTVQILFFIAVILIFCLIWLPYKTNPLSKHDKLTEEEINKSVVKNYGERLQFALYSNDLNFLKEKVSAEYLEYNNLTASDFVNWLNSNEMLTSNVKLVDTTKYECDDVVIYSIDSILSGKSQKINIIETYPEQWVYSFGTFVSYSSNSIKKNNNNYGVIINSIYQDINYIEFKLSLYVSDKVDNKIELSGFDTIKLNMKDKSTFVMSISDYDTDEVVINSNRYITVDCIYNIPISEQANISSITVGSFIVDGEEKNIKVELDI